MLQIVMQLSAPSRMTSYSNSFQPSTDSSTRTCLIREYATPKPTIVSSSSEVRATPLPLPPRVYAARTMTGNPISSTNARAEATSETARLRGIGSPINRIKEANRSRFSPAVIASSFVPSNSTWYLERTPASASSLQRLRAVWPPMPLRIPWGRSFAMIFSRNSTVRGST